MTGGYSEYTHWSVLFGGKATRLSVADEHGREYFMLVPRPRTGWREERERLLDLIGEAIEAGCAPGEVVAVDA